jgi:hypothetical protein
MAAGAAVLLVGERGKTGMLGFEMAQHVLQPVLDPPEIAGAVIGRRFEAFQQIRHALFEMGECRRVVVADRHMVEAVGQRPQRAFEMFRISLTAGRSRLSSDEVSAAMRCSSTANESPRPSDRAKLIDLGRQRVDVVAEPGQRVGGGDVGDDGPQRRDGAFELSDREGSSLARKIRSSLAPRLRIASS